MRSISRCKNILLRMEGVIGSTWNGTLASLRFSPCIVVSSWKLFTGKGRSMASWTNFTEDKRCFKWEWPDVRAINSIKQTKVSTQVGNGEILKCRVK